LDQTPEARTTIAHGLLEALEVEEEIMKRERRKQAKKDDSYEGF
jgi:hypothetical protein